MRKLVFFPSDPIDAYIEKGYTYDYLEKYYNPGGYFDKVYCLSPWDSKRESFGNITCIKAKTAHFKKVIRQIHPDVVRGYGGYWAADWIACSKVRGIPTVVSVHDARKELLYDTVVYADAIWCTSQVVQNLVIEELEVDAGKVGILPNRIDTSVFKHTENAKEFQKLNSKFGDGKHILHVGRKAEEKNIDTVVEALTYLDESYKCIFVGRGDCTKYVDLARSLGVNDRCFFIEAIPNDELPVWYSWCDCMCTPSRKEGFGRVFIEAAACEALIITSNIAPMNEYLVNGKSAILIDDYENPQSIARAISRVEIVDDNISIMKAYAKKVGLAFANDMVSEKEIEMYKKVIRMKPNNKRGPSYKINKKYRYAIY